MNKNRNPNGKAPGTKSRITRFASASRSELIEFFKTQDSKLCEIWQIKARCLLCHNPIVKGQTFRSSYKEINRHVAHDRCLVYESKPVLDLHPSISLTIS